MYSWELVVLIQSAYIYLESLLWLLFFQWLCLNWNVCHLQSSLFTLKPRQKPRHLADDILKCVFLNESTLILIGISLKFLSGGSISIKPVLLQIMTTIHYMNKSGPSLLMHICVTQPQCANIRAMSQQILHDESSTRYSSSMTMTSYGHIFHLPSPYISVGLSPHKGTER